MAKQLVAFTLTPPCYDQMAKTQLCLNGLKVSLLVIKGNEDPNFCGCWLAPKCIYCTQFISIFVEKQPKKIKLINVFSTAFGGDLLVTTHSRACLNF